MDILITNDDGIYAPGLKALAQSLQQIAEVTIVAPEQEQSASGHAVTLHKPLRMKSVEIPGLDGAAYASNGTPADCVILGCLTGLSQPDLVVAGINRGANLGEEILYSGTVSAAMEAALQGVPAFAISVDSYSPTDFEPAAQFARKLAQVLPHADLNDNCFLNVNVPAVPRPEITGIRFTRLGKRAYINKVEHREDLRGQSYYWLAGNPEETDSGEGTDIAAVAAGQISITPMHFDLTSHELLDDLASLVDDLSDW